MSRVIVARGPRYGEVLRGAYEKVLLNSSAPRRAWSAGRRREGSGARHMLTPNRCEIVGCDCPASTGARNVGGRGAVGDPNVTFGRFGARCFRWTGSPAVSLKMRF